MSWVAAAVGVGSAVAGAYSSKKAAGAQAGATKNANATQLAMFNQSRDDYEPYRQAGYEGLNLLQMYLGQQPVERPGGLGRTREDFDASAYLRANPDVAANKHYSRDPFRHWEEWGQGEGRQFALSAVGKQRQEEQDQRLAQMKADGSFGSLLKPFTGENLADDPGYQFRLGEGMKALDRSASARGGLYSGAQLRGLQRYGQEYASNEFTNAFNRDDAQKKSVFNMLSGVSGTGQAATNQVTNQGMQTAGVIGNNLTNMGNARASSYLATGNALSNALNMGGAAYMYNRPSSNPGYGQFTPSAGFGWMSGSGRLGD